MRIYLGPAVAVSLMDKADRTRLAALARRMSVPDILAVLSRAAARKITEVTWMDITSWSFVGICLGAIFQMAGAGEAVSLSGNAYNNNESWWEAADFNGHFGATIPGEALALALLDNIKRADKKEGGHEK